MARDGDRLDLSRLRPRRGGGASEGGKSGHDAVAAPLPMASGRVAAWNDRNRACESPSQRHAAGRRRVMTETIGRGIHAHCAGRDLQISEGYQMTEEIRESNTEQPTAQNSDTETRLCGWSFFLHQMIVVWK